MATDSPIPIKRGSTFTASTVYTPEAGGLPNLIGGTVTSQVLDHCGTRHSLSCTINGAGLVITTGATAAQVAEWATGLAKWDIRVEIGGVVVYTDTAELLIAPQITLAE
jgi:hypothetical protein